MKKILSIILAGLAFFGINKATAEEINMTGKKVFNVIKIFLIQLIEFKRIYTPCGQ